MGVKLCRVVVDCIMGSFMIVLFARYFLADRIKREEIVGRVPRMGERRGAYGVLVVEEPEGNTTWKT